MNDSVSITEKIIAGVNPLNGNVSVDTGIYDGLKVYSVSIHLEGVTPSNIQSVLDEIHEKILLVESKNKNRSLDDIKILSLMRDKLR